MSERKIAGSQFDNQDMRPKLSTLQERQNNKCYYCTCEMNNINTSPHQATVEHLIDKWSSPGHNKIELSSNLVAACFQCNNNRGAIRNRIARDYYKSRTSEKGIKLAVASTSSKILYKMFGPVPQNLFTI